MCKIVDGLETFTRKRFPDLKEDWTVEGTMILSRLLDHCDRWWMIHQVLCSVKELILQPSQMSTINKIILCKQSNILWLPLINKIIWKKKQLIG